MATATPYIPNKNASLIDWMENFQTTVDAAPSTYGLSSSDITQIDNAVGLLVAAWTPMTSPATKTKAVVAAFNAQRQATLVIIRPYAVSISTSPSISPDDKSAAGTTVRKSSLSPVPAPATNPVLTLVSAIIGAVQLQYRDVTTPSSKAKPFGVRGCEVWTSVGTVAATDPSQCALKSTVTKSPFVLSFDPPNSGKILTVFARWVTAGGLASGGVAQTGPWSGSLVLNLV